MAITYKSVIAQVIADFNDIQTAIAGKAADGRTPQYAFDGEVLEDILAVTTDSKLVPTTGLDKVINDYLQLKADGEYEVTSAGTFDITYKKDVKIAAGSYTITGGDLKETNSLALSLTKATDSSSLNNILLGDELSSGSGHYIKIDSSLSGAATIERAAVTSTIHDGYIKAGTTTASGIALSSKSITKPSNKSIYIKINDATIEGGGSGTFKPEISTDTVAKITGATNLGIDLVTAQPTSGFFAKLSSAAQGEKTFAPTVTKGGYIASGALPASSASLGASDSYYLNIPAATCTISGGVGSAKISSTTIIPATDIALSTTATKYSINATAVGSWNVTAITDSHTAGYLTEKNATNWKDAQGDTLSSSAATIYIQEGSLSGIEASNTAYNSYTDLSGENIIIPSEGYLVLNAGYFPNSKISLDSLLGGSADIANFNNAAWLRKGFIAYNEDGKKITGTMPDVTPSFNFTINSGEAQSTTTIIPVSTSPENKGAAKNYNSTTGLTEYVTITANGTGGATAPHASSKYAKAATGYINIAANTEAGSIDGSTVETISDDTNYIAASSISDFVANSGQLTTSASFTNSTTNATNKGTAIHYTTKNLDGTSEADAYVTVTATSSGSVTAGSAKLINVKDNYMLNNISVTSAEIGSASIAETATAYIPAIVDPNGTATSTDASASVNVGTATTFTATGEIKQAGDKTKSSAISGNISGTITNINQKYVIGNVSISGSVSGSAVANIDADATGSTVDSYVESLYMRMLGYTYTPVDPDSN